MKNMDLSKIKRVLFTGDLLRMDENPNSKLSNPQLTNIEWIFTLFAGKVEENLGIMPYIVSGNETNGLFSRIEVYKELSLIMNVESWVQIFEGSFGRKIIEKYLLRTFEDAFVIGFELPPYMINFFNKQHIPYVDITIHPVRYLPDYILGVRSNIETIQNKLEATAFDANLFVEFADLQKALTIRKLRNNLPQPSSVLFLGQTAIDASLIYNGKMAGLQEVREALLNLSIEYENVYYKAHPHTKEIPALKKLVDSLPNVHWYEVNIYDGLSLNRFALVTSLSSGTLYEANYFGQKTSKLLPTAEKFDLYSKDTARHSLYFPSCPQIFSFEYWEYLLGDRDTFSPEFPAVWKNALKTTLNMKWGR